MSTLMTAATLLATEGGKKLAGDMVSFLEKGLPRVYIDVTSKKKVDSGDAFEKYTKKVYATYSKSKTILYRNEEKELSSFFEPPFLRKEETHFNKTPETVKISSENIKEIFKQGGHSKILITGIGGTGKTILLKHLCVNSIVTGFKIPVFVSLRWFNDMDIKDNPLERLIYERLSINGFKLPYEYFLYSLEEDKYIFLLDAYDEIADEKRGIITRRISDFTKRYSKNYFVMTSRPVAQVNGLDTYTILQICSMDFSQVERIILKLEYDLLTKKKFVNKLKMGFYEKYKLLTSIPLTLSVLFLTYVANTEIPETLSEFYEKAFETLLYQHDNQKEGYERVLKSRLERHEFKDIFVHFCYYTYVKNAFSFSETRLIDSISVAVRKANVSVDVYAYKDDLVDVTCMLILEGREYIFLHRSFQEYFAAYYVSTEKLDEEQKSFYATFIRNPTIEFDRMRDFLVMIKNIRHRKFDYLVLLPILKKIHRRYVRVDHDLIRTALRYYSIKPGPVESNRIVRKDKSDPNRRDYVSENEFTVLEFFLFNNERNNEEKNQEIKKFVSENIASIKSLIPPQTKPNMSMSEYSERYCYHRIIMEMKAVVDKYNELVSSYTLEEDLDTMAEKY